METTELTLTREERGELLRRIRNYFNDEFEIELGDLRAEFVLGFFNDLVGQLHYNKAIEDARAIAMSQATRLDEELFGLTRSVNLRSVNDNSD